ncbi:hypothetical protein [Maribacter sp. ACAM166]|uniref:hypothetical protein n=1 Tax=Maribacter sp. ACAM166 TaxID=2508996 RepID=UPI0010FE20F0|nr:hypothetical protein [Maribacter sp. ACAM166]TLP73234.1 hypothetical protein ES765_17375 [Maribacter sp. ACAM166]
MELNRYETVERVIKKLDNKINKLLNEDILKSKELSILIDLRGIYIKEYEGLTRSKNTHEMFKKENGYGK